MTAYLRALWVVFRKELRDGLRDRRSLLSALLYPLIGPLVCGLLFSFLAEQQRDATHVPIPVVGQERAPELINWLGVQGAEVVEAPADPRAAVREGQVPFVVYIPEGHREHLREGQTTKIELIVDGSRNDTRAAVARVTKLLNYYGSEIATKRLLARGISPEVAHPLIVAEVEVASEQELAANLFAFIPMFVLIATFIGGMQLAVETTASERERGSLESLLLNPAPRGAIVGGKWLATLVFALACVALTLLCCVVVVKTTAAAELGASLDLNPATLLGVLLAALPMAVMASALQILVASFARSFKEAQTYMSLLIFLPTVPGIVGMMIGLERSVTTLLIPGVGQQIVVESLLSGGGAGVLDFVLPTATALAVAGICLALTTWLFRRESIVFGL